MKPIPDPYWNLCGAVYAYLYGHLSAMGIDVAGESQLVGYPTQFPSVSMVDWNTGAPNARFRVLQLLKSAFGPGDHIVALRNRLPAVYALAAVNPNGDRRLLLVNERDHDVDVGVSDQIRQIRSVDVTTRGDQPRLSSVNGATVRLRGFSVSVLTLDTAR